MYLTLESFGQIDGRDSALFVLENENGLRLSVTDYGARVVSLLAPDQNGVFADVVLGYNEVKGYETDTAYLGATCGRVANRIGGGAFMLNGVRHELAKNDGNHCLHGGGRGFDRALWSAEMTHAGLRFLYRSPDGEEGFPGNLIAAVTYSINDSNRIKIEYEATADQDTPVNLVNHSYFNMDGRDALGATHHVLSIEADAFCPVDEAMLPTGEQRDVAGTPFDFTSPNRVGGRMGDKDEQLRRANGYDHCYCLRGEAGTLRRAASLTGESGRTLTVYTTMPGLQLYTANFLSRPHTAVCLETEYYPDAVNRPEFLSPVVKAGATQKHVTEWWFTNR